MSLDLICKEMTPYPHWTMEVVSGPGNVMITITCVKLGEFSVHGSNETQTAEDVLKCLKIRKAENV